MIDEISKQDVALLCHQQVINIGKNIKKFRKLKGLTQSDVAFYIFADKSLISALERGVQKNITLLTLTRLCKLFRKNFEDFLAE